MAATMCFQNFTFNWKTNNCSTYHVKKLYKFSASSIRLLNLYAYLTIPVRYSGTFSSVLPRLNSFKAQSHRFVLENPRKKSRFHLGLDIRLSDRQQPSSLAVKKKKKI